MSITIDIPPAAAFARPMAVISSPVARRRVMVRPPASHPSRLRGEGWLVGVQTLGGVVTMVIVQLHAGLEATLQPDWLFEPDAAWPDNVIPFRRPAASTAGWSLDLFADVAVQDSNDRVPA